MGDRRFCQVALVNYQTIGYVERGQYNPSLDLALRAAEYFGLPVEAVFSRRPFRPMSQQLYPGKSRARGAGRARRSVARGGGPPAGRPIGVDGSRVDAPACRAEGQQDEQ